MTYIIAEPCKRSRKCVEVCPVDCIYEVEETQLMEGDVAYKKMLYINPIECINCDECRIVCPEKAIFHEEKVPPKWHAYINYNYNAFGFTR